MRLAIVEVQNGFWMRCAIGLTFHGNPRHVNDWDAGEMFFQVVIV